MLPKYSLKEQLRPQLYCPNKTCSGQNQQNLSIINILGFSDHAVCFKTAQLLHNGLKAAINNRQMNEV